MSYPFPPSPAGGPPAGGPPTGGSIQLTPLRALVVAAVFGGLSGWLAFVVANALDLVPPQVPWTTPIVLVLITALVGVLAYYTHQQVQVRRSRIPPERAVAFLVLGKASALGGAVVAGGYLTYALLFLARFDAEGPRERVIRSLVAVVIGIALTIAGLRLERACRIPDADSDSDGDEDDLGRTDGAGEGGIDPTGRNTGG